jgi:hypothetical protein
LKAGAGKKIAEVCNFEQKAELPAGTILKVPEALPTMPEDTTPQIVVVHSGPTVRTSPISVGVKAV